MSFSKLIVVASICITVARSQPATATLAGSILGDDGQLLAATITANLVGPSAAYGQATSSPRGDFAISGLPFGTYNLCASVMGGGYLDPCGWSVQLPTIILTAEHPLTAGYTLVLSRGVSLQVRVNDPGQILDVPSAAAPAVPGGGTASTAASTVLPHVTIGVFTDRHTFEPLVVINKDATGQNRQGTIPVGRTVSVQLVGRGVTVADATGKAVDVANGTTLSIGGTASAPPQPLTFTVTAKP